MNLRGPKGLRKTKNDAGDISLPGGPPPAMSDLEGLQGGSPLNQDLNSDLFTESSDQLSQPSEFTFADDSASQSPNPDENDSEDSSLDSAEEDSLMKLFTEEDEGLDVKHTWDGLPDIDIHDLFDECIEIAGLLESHCYNVGPELLEDSENDF